MPRPRSDGSPPNQTTRVRLTDAAVRRAKPTTQRTLLYDTDLRGFCLSVEPSGSKAFKVIYGHEGKKRWFTIGRADALSVTRARNLARETIARVYQGGDPQSERSERKRAATFGTLVEQYLADKKVQAGKRTLGQSEWRLSKYVLPVWGGLSAFEIRPAQVRSLHSQLTARVGPYAANNALADASAVFTWAIKNDKVPNNPCRGLEYNPPNPRGRVLSDAEVPAVWAAFNSYGPCSGSALKMILLTGQRPGEVRHMRWEHIIGRWWCMPGKPDEALDWPGTKNTHDHRVWLSEPAWALLLDIGPQKEGFVFHTASGKASYDLPKVMRRITERLSLRSSLTPHDLRRTNGTTITRLGYGRDAMNRIQNHIEGGIADIYDRYGYEKENIAIMEAVAAEFMKILGADCATAA